MSDVITRLSKFEGKEFGDKGVRNPRITARDAVYLAEYIKGLKYGLVCAINNMEEWNGQDIDKGTTDLIAKLKGLISDES